MLKQGLNKFRVVAGGSLLVLALASAPASAHHDYSIVGPAVAFIALGALFHHGHHSHNGYGGHNYGHQRRHYKPYRRHSRSYGGYHNIQRPYCC